VLDVYLSYVLSTKLIDPPHCLLDRRNYSEIELLFQLLRAFTGRFLCNMTFLKEYMEEEIPKNYSIAQKRALFFRFVEFNDPHFNDELKAKVRTINGFDQSSGWRF